MMEENGLPKGWVETTLGEVMSIYSGKTRPEISGIYPVYGGNGILYYGDNYNQENETIIIGRVGAYCGNVFIENEKFWLSDNALGVKNNSNSEIMFLYYKLKHMKLNNFAIGAAQPLLTQTLLKELKITIPKSTNEQKAIASILTSFDDKIELLQAQNETLENIAQTIFKEWFDKYQVGDELPEGWRVDKLENISLEITRGFTTKYVDKSNLINLNQKVNKGSYLDKQHFKYYDDKTIVPENKFIKKYDILLNSLGEGTLGRVHLYCEETDNVVADQHISILRFDKKLAFYVYHVLTSKDGQFRLLNEISGSTGMTMLNISKVRQFEIIVPNDIILGEFKMIITALYEKLEINNSQIQTLQATRDTLLPKLMSGQLRVTEFQEQLCEVM